LTILVLIVLLALLASTIVLADGRGRRGGNDNGDAVGSLIFGMILGSILSGDSGQGCAPVALPPCAPQYGYGYQQPYYQPPVYQPPVYQPYYQPAPNYGGYYGGYDTDNAALRLQNERLRDQIAVNNAQRQLNDALARLRSRGY